MNKRLIAVLLLSLAALAGVGLALLQNSVQPQRIVQIGEKAVDAEFLDIQGNKHHLSELLSDGRYVLLDFWALGCRPCREAERELKEVYEETKDILEIVGINMDKSSHWKEAPGSQSIVWQNWHEDKTDGPGIEKSYLEMPAIPYYVLIAPDGTVLSKSAGYLMGRFKGLEAALRGPRQDNFSESRLAITSVDCTIDSTTLHFRYYGMDKFWFVIYNKPYISANGDKYKLISANGIKLGAHAYPSQKEAQNGEGAPAELRYMDFSLSFEPFKIKPKEFDFIDSDGKGEEDGMNIRNIAVE